MPRGTRPFKALWSSTGWIRSTCTWRRQVPTARGSRFIRLTVQRPPSRWPLFEFFRSTAIAPRHDRLARYARPSKVLEPLRERHIVDERRELAIEERQFHLFGERRGELPGTAYCNRPRACIARDILEPPECAQERRGRLRTKAANAWDAVCRITDKRKPIGHCRRANASRSQELVLVDDPLAHPVDLYDVSSPDRLRQVLVGREHAHLVHVVSKACCGGGDRVVGLLAVR